MVRAAPTYAAPAPVVQAAPVFTAPAPVYSAPVMAMPQYDQEKVQIDAMDEAVEQAEDMSQWCELMKEVADAKKKFLEKQKSLMKHDYECLHPKPEEPKKEKPAEKKEEKKE